MDCIHELEYLTRSVGRKDGKEMLNIQCILCTRQWYCEPINFAPMGQPPIWVRPD